MDASQRLKELFSRYLQHKADPAEVEEMVILLELGDAEDTLSAPMRALWEELKSHPVEYPIAWDKMYREVSQVEKDLSSLKRRRGALLYRMGWHRGGYRAASVAILFLAGIAIYWSVKRDKRPEGKTLMAGSSNIVSIKASPGAVTASGLPVADRGLAREKKRVVHLPDGSMVILNKHSKLDYPETFTGGVREVTLSGEAYFDIVHRPGQPFVVHTGKIVTQVLGTAFNIKAYPSENDIEVTVDHGKVQVLKGPASMGLLTDNEQIRYNRGTEGYVWQKVNAKPVIAWKPEEIAFDDITMEEAARRIEKRFGVAVTFINPVLKECRVTATFYQEDDLDEIMTVICAVSQSNFVIREGKISIDGKGCN